MFLDNIYAEDYDIEFNGENTFISDPNDTLMSIAPQKLKILDAKGHTILVTDPYLFPNFESAYAHEEPQYEVDLEKLIEGCGASKIIFCAKTVKNAPLYQRMKAKLSKKGIILTHTNQLERCHDRFWYCVETQKCICFGTSLNGIGKAICQINELEEDDIKILKKYFSKAGLI